MYLRELMCIFLGLAYGALLGLAVEMAFEGFAEKNGWLPSDSAFVVYESKMESILAHRRGLMSLELNSDVGCDPDMDLIRWLSFLHWLSARGRSILCFTSFGAAIGAIATRRLFEMQVRNESVHGCSVIGVE